MAEISLKHINKNYGNDVQAVTDFNLEIKDKEFIVFVGPSGCGKSTTLRMIAGLEGISSGDLIINQKRMNDIAPKDRDIAMVFQNYALYPHMTVYDNLKFGLQIKRIGKKEMGEKIQEAAKILGLEEFLNRKPKALSGGQRQRVALGRAIVKESKLFLMDEPLSNLDAKLRVQMRSEIIKLHKRLGTTTIYVTHDQTEAMTMASRIVIMDKGVIQQVGTPKEIYNDPVNIFVASFIGSPSINLFEGRITEAGLQMKNETIQLPQEWIEKVKGTDYYSKDILLGIRPEHMIVQEEKDKDTSFQACIEIQELIGAESLLYSNIDGTNFIARFDSDTDIKPGTKINFALNPTKIHLFDKQTGIRVGIGGQIPCPADAQAI